MNDDEEYSELEEKLYAAHEAEAADKQREIYNLSWAQTPTGVASKCSDNWILDSEIDPVTMEVTHIWTKKT